MEHEHTRACEVSGIVAAKTAIVAALYWSLGANESSGPKDLQAVRPKLVAGLMANTHCTRSGLAFKFKYM